MEPSLVTKYHEFTHTSEVDTSDVMFEVHEVYDGDKATKHLIPTAWTSRSCHDLMMEEHKSNTLEMYEDIAIVEGEGLFCDMIFKWRPMIPEECRDQLCLKPTEEKQAHRNKKRSKALRNKKK